MANTNGSAPTSVVVSLAAFKAARFRNSGPALAGERCVLAVRLRTPQEMEHRRRMLRHLRQEAGTSAPAGQA